MPRGRPSRRWQISATAGGVLVGQREPRLHATRTLDEEADRFARERIVRPFPLARHAERRDGVLLLDRESERRAARHQDVQPGRRLEQLHDPRRRIDHMLEVVKHEEHLAIGQVASQALGRCRARVLHEREARRDGRRDQAGIRDRIERHQPRAVLELAGRSSGELDRQPRLARAARPGQRDEALLAHERAKLDEVRHAPDEARDRVRQVADRPIDRAQRREVGAHAIDDELVKALGSGEILQLELAERAEPDAGWQRSFDERARGVGHEDLSAMRQCRDPRGAIDVHADVVVAAERADARVQAHPDPDGRVAGPGRLVKRHLCPRGRRRGRRRLREHHQERVTLRPALNATVGRERLAENRVVLIEHLGEGRRPEILHEPRRAFHVREQEGHGSGGEGPIGHG